VFLVSLNIAFNINFFGVIITYFVEFEKASFAACYRYYGAAP
jgi:hypothetical protein